MYFILYTSQVANFLAVEDFAGILVQCRKNNIIKNITGLLLYHEGSFMQILEGEKADVLALYEAIKKDDRHRQVQTLVAGEQSKRNFPDWAMGFKGFAGGQEIVVPGYINLTHNTLIFEGDRPDAHPALAYLKKFYAGMV